VIEQTDRLLLLSHEYPISEFLSVEQIGYDKLNSLMLVDCKLSEIVERVERAKTMTVQNLAG
jgi:hypothetical protein